MLTILSYLKLAGESTCKRLEVGSGGEGFLFGFSAMVIPSHPFIRYGTSAPGGKCYTDTAI